MFGSSPTATTLIGALAALLILGYVVGSQLNRRRARALANSLRAALRTLDGEPAFSQLGAFGFSARAEPKGGPIRSIQAAVILLPREIPPLWLLRRLSGVTDLLTLRVTLVKAPRFEGDLLDTHAPYGRRAARRIPAGWSRRQGDGWLAAAPDEVALDRAADLGGAAREAGLAAQIISLRQVSPHLLITLEAPASEAEALQLIAGAKRLGDEASSSQSESARRARERASGSTGGSRRR